MHCKTYFFRSRELSSARTANSREFCIQIPSQQDIKQMRHMPAGEREDQLERLMHMVAKINQIHQEHPNLPLITSDAANLPDYWIKLFTAIQKADEKAAFAQLNNIPLRDVILQVLSKTHSLEYLQQLIHNSIKAQTTQGLNLGNDIIITPRTLEVLIKDIATTLFHHSKIHFSFGLPSHHAFTSTGSGFCVLDKTMMLLMHNAQTHVESCKYIIIGTDVNRDNGLSHELMSVVLDKLSPQDSCSLEKRL